MLDVQILFTFILQIKRHTLPASLHTVRAGEFTVQFTSGYFIPHFPYSSTALQECAAAAASQQKYYLKGLFHYNRMVLLIRTTRKRTEIITLPCGSSAENKEATTFKFYDKNYFLPLLTDYLLQLMLFEN